MICHVQIATAALVIVQYSYKASLSPLLTLALLPHCQLVVTLQTTPNLTARLPTSFLRSKTKAFLQKPRQGNGSLTRGTASIQGKWARQEFLHQIRIIRGCLTDTSLCPFSEQFVCCPLMHQTKGLPSCPTEVPSALPSGV
jgi:hypothetical protein